MILRAIAKSVENAVGRGTGFALFLYQPHMITADYISNATREDVIVLLEDWLLRQTGVTSKASHDQTTQEVDSRLGLERLCVDLGSAIKNVPGVEVALFLFDFGEHGSVAYFQSDAKMRAHVATRIKTKKSVS